MSKLREITSPSDELETILKEATQAVEDDLALEDAGYINISAGTRDVITASERETNLLTSRLYYTKDPMARQAIRLWTDYTFGPGMAWDTEDKPAKKALEGFWNAPTNQTTLSARGQRKSSDKLLVDGEIFFAIFLGYRGGVTTIRRIDPLEITEIITNPEDIEDVKFYVRDWTDSQGSSHQTIYRSTTNPKGELAKSAIGATVRHNDDALVYHLTYNTITQRGNPLLLPALPWLKYYTKFLGSRIAIMLALATFAWSQKIKGGQAAVNAIKAKTDGVKIPAGSTKIENEGVETLPIKTDTGAMNAYQDGRQIKLQICAATGLYEQYFGDVSAGSLATAQTVELPMQKQFQSYQKVWADTYQDINELILAQNDLKTDIHIDMDFPAIAPADVAKIGQTLSLMVQAFPEFAYSDDVRQTALMALGINDPAEVLDQLTQEAKGNPDVRLVKALKQFQEVLKKKE